MIKVNIVIPIHNRLEHTKQTLISLYENTNPALFDLWLIDDLSTEPVYDWLNEFCFEMEQKHGELADITIMKNLKNIGPGASRNYVCDAITKSNNRGEYLYHSDNDVYFTQGWLDKLIDVFQHSSADDIKVLGASCHPYLQSSSHIYCDVHGYAIGIKDAVSGYSQLMTWDTWDKYGPFDETMRDAEVKIMGSEDWAFCQKIVQDGFKVGSIEPEVVIPCGKTNTYGNPATGAETFKSFDGVKVI